jgi:hypothetical protein
MLRFVLALTAAAAAASQLAAMERAALDRGTAPLPLLPAARCEEAQDVAHCRVALPKDWSDDERRSIEDALRRLTAGAMVQGIVVGALEHGYAGLRRYATDTRVDQRLGRVAKFSPGFVLFPPKIIGLTDAYFQTQDMKDPISDYRFGDLILLHELIHAFDDRTLSTDAGFTSLTGWVFSNNRWDFTRRVSISEYNGVVAHTMTLYGRGRYLDAWTADRSFATTMAFPLPTIQALATPGESFADILAHLILDPRAATYLRPDVVAWFRSNVFPVLQEKARRFPVQPSAARADPFSIGSHHCLATASNFKIRSRASPSWSLAPHGDPLVG